MDEKENKKPNLNSARGKGRRDVSDPTLAKVLEKVDEAESVLVALSNDPTVDEIAAAMGLSMALDNAGKHVTAIYSGKTPNVLEFLKPEERFETGTESLQDFVIALNKDKADHLRYKIDGDFVKVYVTPYKTTISGDDIEFSRGDFNVDLVIALNVPAATELDAALKEHGRIMHDATSVNITNGAAGKFGDVEWVDAKASSISEMVSKLAFELEGKMDAATATALLTGLVAATDRFKNPATTPDAMVLAAKLMGAGADQQLVVQNVQGEVVFNGEDAGARNVVVPEADDDSGPDDGGAKDATNLSISHGDDDSDPGVSDVETGAGKPILENESGRDSELKDEVHIEEGNVNDDSGGSAGVINDDSISNEDPVKAAMASALGTAASGAEQAPVNSGTVAGVDVAVVPENADGYAGATMADQILSNIEKTQSNVGATDYGKMIDEALDEPLPGEGGIQVGQQGANGAQVNTQDVDKVDVPQGNPMAGVMGGPMPEPATSSVSEEEEAMNIIKAAQAEANAPIPGMPANGELPKIITGGGMSIGEVPVGTEQNPAMSNAPTIGTAPEMGGVPEMNFGAGPEPSGSQMGDSSMGGLSMGGSAVMGQSPMGVTSEPNPMPMPGQDTLPPPPTPMPDFGAMPPSVPMNDGGAMGMSSMPTENTIPVPTQEPVATPSVTVQPDMNADLAAMALPQVPEAQAVTEEAPVDPSAFKIPGIHT